MKQLSSLPPTRTQPCALPWEQSSGSASKHKNAKGEYDNYFNTTFHLDVSGLSIKRQLAAALVELRFLHLAVASTAVREEGKPPATYPVHGACRQHRSAEMGAQLHLSTD